jgi:EAL domain-containing protein (putative c-di-GMP-specific phosphodiesterase class I)
VPVAINLSAKQFQRKDICAMVTEALERHGIEPWLLEIEITESAAMQNVEESLATLQKLRDIGISISIDDFGTGYSSLGQLKRLPVTALKIDRSFITGLPADDDDKSIAQAIISMAHSLQLTVIAEGVETESQRMFLAAYGCDEIQGYLVAKPMPARDFALFLQSQRRQPGSVVRDPEMA